MARNGSLITDEGQFLEDVEGFMNNRGVPFEREAKVAGRPAPLHKLYKLVMEKGGYDVVSANRMMWREVAKSFDFPSAHEGAMSYQLKNLYYKNLAAYEIARYWGEEPPPRQILEDTTAKGGDLRKRTLDTFPSLGSKPLGDNETVSDADTPDDQQTPKQERADGDDPGSANRYPTRLRQQPKQTQPYQADLLNARTNKGARLDSPTAATMAASAASLTPTPSYTGSSSDPRNPSFSLERYEPRQPNPLTLRPVITAGSRPDVYLTKKAQEKATRLSRLEPEYQDFVRPVIPPSSLSGPNIYQRCVFGLRSGIKEEQDFSLHHLVKVSYERGDKFKFEGFPLLAESLIEKALEITELAFGVTFQISYNDEPGKEAPNTLNALYGTSDLHERLEALDAYVDEFELEPEGFIERLEKLNEAALIVRNMMTLSDNSMFIAKFPLFRDLLVVCLDLPKDSRFAEFRQYGLEMAELVTRYWDIPVRDSLYKALVNQLESSDRGKILCALHALFRIDADSERPADFGNVPLHIVERLISFCLLDDDELVEATMDVLYALTAFPKNMSKILHLDPALLPNFTLRLTRLLLHNAQSQEEAVYHRREAPRPVVPASITVIPNELFVQLLSYPEPERSARWLRSCFEESPEDDVTQIAIWQAYNGRFQHHQPVPAAEFIKMVSTTFGSAQAQVINTEPPRFIIKGIRPRRVLIDLRGQPFLKCLWEITPQTPAGYHGPPPRGHICGSWHSSPLNMYNHICHDHLSIPRNQDGTFTNKGWQCPQDGVRCRWLTCSRRAGFHKANEIAQHLKAHIPKTNEHMRDLILEIAGIPTKKKDDENVTKHIFYSTPTDERGHPHGISFMSGMILRNLAQYIGRHGGNVEERQELAGRMFSPEVREELWFMASAHRTLCNLIGELIVMIEAGEASEKKRKAEDEPDVAGDTSVL